MSLHKDPVLPMLAVSGTPFSDDGWLFEPKFDGIRCLASMQKQKAILRNRRLSIITEMFPEIAKAVLDAVNADCVLDGEIVILKDGKPDVSAIQRRMSTGSPLLHQVSARTNPAQYVVFDIIERDGIPLISLPLVERKGILAGVLRQSATVLLTNYIEKSGEKFFFF